MIPLASHEVRWFFSGDLNQHAVLKRWFESSDPVPKREGVAAPAWKGRRNDQPDVYLMLAGSDDMGIKSREGELQIKGRTADLGTQIFCGRHQGRVERWVKWSYSQLPEAIEELFRSDSESQLPTVSVRKTRAIRKVTLDPLKGQMEEVSPDTVIDRGLGVELSNLTVDGNPYCSLAFEAFPDDSAMHAAFTDVVETFLSGLTELSLGSSDSWSYPAWLRHRE